MLFMIKTAMASPLWFVTPRVWHLDWWLGSVTSRLVAWVCDLSTVVSSVASCGNHRICLDTSTHIHL